MSESKKSKDNKTSSQARGRAEGRPVAKKKTISEAEALVLLQQVTRETEQRMAGTREANRKVVTLVIVGVGICVLVAVLMLVMGSGR